MGEYRCSRARLADADCMATTLSDPAAIQHFRRLTILKGLELEVKTGMRHSQNGPTKAAQAMLTAAGKRAPRTKKALLKEFRELCELTGIPKKGTQV